MNRMSQVVLAMLGCLLIGSLSHAGDVTIDGNVKVTHSGGGFYLVEYSGTLKLEDVGGGYEKWSSVKVWVVQQGKDPQGMGISKLTEPTLTKDGSYTASGSILADPLIPDWTAFAEITFAVGPMKMDRKTAQKDFKTVP